MCLLWVPNLLQALLRRPHRLWEWSSHGRVKRWWEARNPLLVMPFEAIWLRSESLHHALWSGGHHTLEVHVLLRWGNLHMSRGQASCLFFMQSQRWFLTSVLAVYWRPNLQTWLTPSQSWKYEAFFAWVQSLQKPISRHLRSESWSPDQRQT